MTLGFGPNILRAQVPRRNYLWNQIVRAIRQEDESLEKVHDFLKQFEAQPVLPEIDASVILAVDEAIKLEELKIKDLKELRKTITEGGSMTDH